MYRSMVDIQSATTEIRQGKKPQFLANFDFLGTPVPTPFTHEGQIWHHIADPWYMLTWHLVVSPIDSRLRKLKTGALLQTLPAYPTVSKSALYSNAFMAKSGAQSLTFKSVMNRQTNKQTDKKTQGFWLPRVKSERPPNLAR